MNKPTFYTLSLLISIFLLTGCNRLAERDLAQHLNSRPPAVTMPYDDPQYLLRSVPDQLPFSFIASTDGELLGTVEDSGHKSGTILLKTDQSASDILAYYTNLLAGAALTNTSESRSYQVFFPPDVSGATFCGDQGVAVFLDIFESGDGFKDVRLHYTIDNEVIEHTTCGQPILDIEDFPFPYLEAPPNSVVVGGGGGGGGGRSGTRKGPMGYAVEVEINSDDSLEAVYNHYIDLLAAEGWILLDQSSTENAFESNWDFGFYESRSWLARLIASAGDAPNQYIIKLQAISP